MKDEMTVKELKDILAKYEDDDWVVLEAYPDWDGGEASFYVGDDEILHYEY